jgi:hypothetical protein
VIDGNTIEGEAMGKMVEAIGIYNKTIVEISMARCEIGDHGFI